jgi:hypothetical protein
MYGEVLGCAGLRLSQQGRAAVCLVTVIVTVDSESGNVQVRSSIMFWAVTL